MEVRSKELNYLLNNYWCVKEFNTKEYFDIKNNLDYYREFIRDKLGSKLIVNDRFIKLEKIPSVPKTYMGIPNFSEKLEYVLLFIILLFLEDKPKSTQFILSSLIDYISNTSIKLEIDNVPNWNVLHHRKCLVNVIKHLCSVGVIKAIEEENFAEDSAAEALYETTGLSNYYVREFKGNILDYETLEEYVNDEFNNQSILVGDVRRYKVFRHLFYSLCAFKCDLTMAEEDYFKKFRGSISNEIGKYSLSELEITKNMVTLVNSNESREKQDFPNNKAISDIVLLFNNNVLSKIESGEIKLNNEECAFVSRETVARILKEVREENVMYFSKNYKDMTLDNFIREVTNYLVEYDFVRKSEFGYSIMPSVSRLIGYIPKDSEVQLNLFGGEE